MDVKLQNEQTNDGQNGVRLDEQRGMWTNQWMDEWTNGRMITMLEDTQVQVNALINKKDNAIDLENSEVCRNKQQCALIAAGLTDGWKYD